MSAFLLSTLSVQSRATRRTGSAQRISEDSVSGAENCRDRLFVRTIDKHGVSVPELTESEERCAAMPDNLLVVFADEMRGQAMSCAGNENLRTPSLDLLAEQGTRFTRSYSNTPVCTPARGSMLTGMFPLRHGAVMNDLAIRVESTSIARVLKSEGYRCGYIGKWHLGGIPRSRFIPPGPERLGFDDYWASWNCHHNYYEPKYFLDSPEPVFAEGYEPEVQTDLALGFMENHLAENTSDPFCLFLSWGPPHDPYRPLPPERVKRVNPDSIELRPNCPDTPEHRRNLADYYTHIQALDEQFGRLLEFLDANQLRENTLVVFLSDHGSMLGSQGSYFKQQPWVESVNVPLIMRYPEVVPRGRTSRMLVSIMDLAPTLLGLLKMPIPTQMQGRDLAPQIASSAPIPNRVVYLSEQINLGQAVGLGIKPWRGVKTVRYTYIRNIDGPWLLYDDMRDPYQMENLVGIAGMTSIIERLDDVLLEQMEFYDDRLLETEAFAQVYGLTDAIEDRNNHLHCGTNMAGGWPSDDGS